MTTERVWPYFAPKVEEFLREWIGLEGHYCDYCRRDRWSRKWTVEAAHQELFNIVGYESGQVKLGEPLEPDAYIILICGRHKNSWWPVGRGY